MPPQDMEGPRHPGEWKAFEPEPGAQRPPECGNVQVDHVRLLADEQAVSENLREEDILGLVHGIHERVLLRSESPRGRSI